MEKQPSKFAWLWFTLIRLGLFAVLLAVFVILLPVQPWVSAILAAVVAFCVSYLFLSKPRAAVSQQLAEARAGRSGSTAKDDADAEDAATEDTGTRA